MNRRRAGAIVLAAAACALAALLCDAESFLRAWLFAWTTWTGVALGSLGVLLLWHVTGGAWGTVTRRPLEAAAATIPWLAVGFLPVALGLRSIFPWVDAPAGGAAGSFRAAWLSPLFFDARAVVYLATWSILARVFLRGSRDEERTGEDAVAVAQRLKRRAAPGLLVFTVTVGFAAMDWTMSLEPQFASAAYGIVEVAGQCVAAIAFSILVLVALSDRPALRGRLLPRHFHDLGNLLLAFVMSWAYVSFGQFLILWSGNLPRETPWLLRRVHAPFGALAWSLVLLHLALPMLVLLSRDVKRSPARLGAVAALVAALHVVERFWLIAPAWDGGLVRRGFDALLFATVGAVWLAGFAVALRAAPLLPASFDAAPEGLAHE